MRCLAVLVVVALAGCSVPGQDPGEGVAAKPDGAAAPAAAGPSRINWTSNVEGPIAFEVHVRSPGPCEGLISAGITERYAYPMVWREGSGLPGMASPLWPSAEAMGHSTAFMTPFKFGFRLSKESDWRNATYLVAFQEARRTDELGGAAFSAILECPEGATIETRAARQVLAGGLDVLGCKVAATVPFLEYACIDASWEGRFEGDIQWAAYFGMGVQDMTIETPTAKYHWETLEGPAPEELAWEPGDYRISVAHSVTVPTIISIRVMLLAGLQPVDSPDDLDHLPT